MQFRTQSELELALFTEWRGLREAKRLDQFLPRCGTRQWVGEKGRHGYSALDYRLLRDVQLPKSLDEAPLPNVSLVEKYWSVRTLNGQEDPSWPPSLNVNVIRVTNGPATIDVCETVLRQAVLLRRSIMSTSREWFRDHSQARFHVRAAVVAATIMPDAASLAAMYELHEIPFTVAKYELSAVSGLSFVGVEALDRYSLLIPTDHEGPAAISSALLDGDELPKSEFRWNGLNQGPTFDVKIGLTIHDGRVV